MRCHFYFYVPYQQKPSSFRSFIFTECNSAHEFVFHASVYLYKCAPGSPCRSRTHIALLNSVHDMENAYGRKHIFVWSWFPFAISSYQAAAFYSPKRKHCPFITLEGVMPAGKPYSQLRRCLPDAVAIES